MKIDEAVATMMPQIMAAVNERTTGPPKKGTGKKGMGMGTDPRKFALARPHGVFVDKNGRVLIGDSESHRVLGVW